MGSTAILILGAISFLVVIAFTVLILVVAFRNGNKTTSSTTTNQTVDYSSSAAPAPTPVVSQINWTEVTRGFPTSFFPPCVEWSAEVKKIFTILKNYNLEKKYMQLLDTYSMVLCQEAQVKSRNCSDTFINDRIADLNTYGGNPNDSNAINIVKSVTALNNTKMGKLLVMATNIIETQMAQVRNDPLISKTDKEQMDGYNSLFYRQHYDFMNKRCP